MSISFATIEEKIKMVTMFKDILSSIVLVLICGFAFFSWDYKTDKELINSQYVCVASQGEISEENFIFASTQTAYFKVLKPDGVESLETLSCQNAQNNRIVGYYPIEVNKKIFTLTYQKIIYAKLDKDISILNAEDALNKKIKGLGINVI